MCAYSWLDGISREPAVLFLAKALLRAMDRNPERILALEPIALKVLNADVKTLSNVCFLLSPLEQEEVLRVRDEAKADGLGEETRTALRSGWVAK